MKRDRFSAIVKRALVYSVVDMGQLKHEEELDLKYAVRKGWLVKGKGGPWPILKTVYARPGFDFAADREASEAELARAHMLSMSRGVAHFFPWVDFQKIA